MKPKPPSLPTHAKGSLTEATIRREFQNFRRNAILRILAAGQGKPLPPKYKIKLPD
jgi:hypothetical protein